MNYKYKNNGNNRYDFIRNTLFSTISECSAVFLYIFAILVARTLGPEKYGVFVFALSFGTIYAVFVRFGFFSYLSRELPLCKKQKGEYKFHSVIGSQLWLMLLSTIVFLPICMLLPKSSTDKNIILIVCGAMLFHAFKEPFRGVLRGMDYFHKDSFIVVNERLLILSVAILAYINSWGLPAIAAGFLLARLIDFIISVIVTSKIAVFNVVLNTQVVKSTVQKAWPFATMMLLFMIYNYCDTIMISLMLTDKDVGFYNISYQVLEGSQIFPSSVTGSMLPLLTIHYLNNISYANHLLNFGIELMFYLSLPIVIFFNIYTEEIISFLYGSSYIPAVPVLQLIIWSVPVFFLSVVARSAFFAAKEERTYACIFGASVAFNIVLNIPMIYYFNLIGACIATLLTELVVCILLFINLKKLSYKYNLLRNMRNPLFVNIVIFGILYLARVNNIHFLLAGVGSVLLYLTIIYFCKLITIDDIRALRKN
ncbi:MAG: flippase [Deltaproteobacteria bacterium]|nr:flippase [Deltaproteobacteria bacterium]